MKITNFAVKNYQFTLIIFLLFAVVGVLTLFTMPRSEDPTIHPPEYLITVIYPGTSPKDMEEQVVKPIENKIYGLENIDKMLNLCKQFKLQYVTFPIRVAFAKQSMNSLNKLLSFDPTYTLTLWDTTPSEIDQNIFNWLVEHLTDRVYFDLPAYL